MEVTTLADGSVLVPCRACSGMGRASPESRAFAKVYTCDGCHGAGVHRLAAKSPALASPALACGHRAGDKGLELGYRADGFTYYYCPTCGFEVGKTPSVRR